MASKTLNEMTAAECRDWLAKDDGWTIYTEGLPIPHYLAPGKHPDDECQIAHPYPLTLDGAASAMPEGWEYNSRYSAVVVTDRAWSATAFPRGMGYMEAFDSRRMFQIDSPDEITARYRLAVACRQAMKETA